MTEQNMDNVMPPQAPKTKKIWRILRWVILLLIFIILLLVIGIFALASSDRGSQWLLDTAMKSQKMVKYQYEKGNLIEGVIVRDILVKVKDVEVQVARADLNLGWRAVLNKEIHLTRIDTGVVKVINHAPSKDEEFQFKPIKLPFVLRLDDATINQLIIQNQKSKTVFKDIQAYDVLWSDTKITLKNSSMDMGYLNAKKLNGFIQLDGKYPVNLTGDVTIPALKTLNVTEIKLNARGSLDTLYAGAAAATPDIFSGYAILHPMRKNVPMTGKFSWQQFKWPLLQDQQLYSEAGLVEISGDITKLNFNLDTDLSGKNIPQGNYQAAMYTDLKQLNIEDFQGTVMQGKINLAGVLGWQKGVSWNIQGNMQGLNRQDKNIPAVAQQFLPPNMDGKIESKGSLDQNMDIIATIDFAKYEKWDVHLKQAAKTDKKQPINMTVAWHGINRQFPYVGWLNSANGDVDLVLADQGQDIKVATTITQHEQSMLPEGRYAATLNFAKQILDVKDFSLTQKNASQLLGQAKVHLPTDKTQLKWAANIKAIQFNPQNIVATAPVNRVDGTILADGYAEPNKQIIHLKSIDLKGRLQQGATQQQLGLTGKSTIAVLLHDGKQQTGLKGYAVDYQGNLNAENYTKGPLLVKLSGTPSLIKVAKLYHEGAAGKIDVDGVVNFSQGLMWDLRAQVDQFKPNYFVSVLKGDITGKFNTQGAWSAKNKFVEVRNLDLYGILNNKKLLGKGNLAVSLNPAQGLQLKNNNNSLLLSYAGNILHMVGDGQSGLKLNIKADRLDAIHSKLHGAIKGAMAIQTTPELTVKSKLFAENLGFGQVFNIKSGKLVGTLPTSSTVPTQLLLEVTDVASGDKKVGDLKVNMRGMKSAHILDLNAENNVANFAIKLAGGLSAQGDWLGQLQGGLLQSVQTSKKLEYKQDQSTNVIFRKQNMRLSLSPHCWSGRQNAKFCFTQPVLLSKEQGGIALGLKSIELGDFQEFLPYGFDLTGQLNGLAKLSWLSGQPMKLDAQLISSKGTVGLVSEDQGNPIAFNYDSISLIAKTLAEGISLNFKAETPLLGRGFANLMIANDANKSLKGLVSVDEMRLDLFKPFVSDLRVLSGQLSLAGRLSGQLTKPQFSGELRLKDGAVALASVPLDLQKIQLSAAIQNNNANIKGRFNAGRGEGSLVGSVDFAKNPAIDLTLKGTRLQLIQPPLVSAQVSPDLRVSVSPSDKKLVVNGFIGIPQATISMPEVSASAISVSPDVRVIDARKQHEFSAAVRAWDINANIEVQLNKNLKTDPDIDVSRRANQKVIFQAFNGVIPLAGRLVLNQKGKEIALRATGTMGLPNEVMIEAYGQRLDLKRAIARFNGELANPTLDIEASKDVQNSTVGVRVTGGASRPNIQVFNDAGLSEQEAVNALITGRISSGSSGMNNAEGFKSDVNNTIAAAGISMGLGGTRAFTNQLGRKFGLSGLALDAQGAGDDTQVSVTGYITPDLYLRYGVGIFTPVNTLTLRYQVNRRLYIEATSSLERAVDIFYNWRF